MKRTIIITEEQMSSIFGEKQNEGFDVFNREIRFFIYNLVKGNHDDISEYWGLNGYKNSEIFKLLKNLNIIEVEDDVVNCLRYNFEGKLNRMYHQLFPNDDPDMIISETDCGSVGGSFEAPFSAVQRRKIGFNNK